MKIYNPKDWYWIVGGDATKAYSSALGDYVSAGDVAFAAWKQDGTLPTNIDTEANLGEVLAAYSIRPVHAGVLDGYTESHSRKLTVEVVAKILLWCVNEIRALKGQPALNAQQFRAFIKGQM